MATGGENLSAIWRESTTSRRIIYELRKGENCGPTVISHRKRNWQTDFEMTRQKILKKISRSKNILKSFVNIYADVTIVCRCASKHLNGQSLAAYLFSD